MKSTLKSRLAGVCLFLALSFTAPALMAQEPLVAVMKTSMGEIHPDGR